jgi:hypothetical protein
MGGDGGRDDTPWCRGRGARGADGVKGRIATPSITGVSGAHGAIKVAQLSPTVYQRFTGLAPEPAKKWYWPF